MITPIMTKSLNAAAISPSVNCAGLNIESLEFVEGYYNDCSGLHRTGKPPLYRRACHRKLKGRTSRPRELISNLELEQLSRISCCRSTKRDADYKSERAAVSETVEVDR